MAAKKKTKKAAAPKKPGTRHRRGVTLKPSELAPTELSIAEPEGDLAELANTVRAEGGAVLASYREPLGGHAVLLVALPVDRVAPTPFQRDVSDAHVRKLSLAMNKTRRFLDPIIAVRIGDRFLTPNGNHRLTVLKELGATSVIALLVPETKVAYQILALNIEKAHNLRERALEVGRLYVDLAGFVKDSEETFSLELEDPGLVTLGFGYLARPRLSGGAYHPALRKVDAWIPGPLAAAMDERKRRATKVLTLDEAVTGAVDRLKEKGLTSPYLRTFVVARVNPLRFIKGTLPSFDDLLDDMTRKAQKLDAGKIRPDDLARSGGAPEEE